MPRKAALRTACILAASAAAVLTLAACSSSSTASTNWYANGKQYAVKSTQAQGGARLMGPSARSLCLQVLTAPGARNRNVAGAPLDAPPISDTVANQAWLSGCVAGGG